MNEAIIDIGAPLHASDVGHDELVCLRLVTITIRTTAMARTNQISISGHMKSTLADILEAVEAHLSDIPCPPPT